MGLGPLHTITLAEARAKALELRKARLAGIDPLGAKRAAAQANAEAAGRAITFRKVADFYIAAHAAGWRNTKHAGQWRATLETYAYPHFGELAVSKVGTDHVLVALEPIWREKPETASRVRGRIEAVLDYAKVREWRSGENPARWRGHLDHLLPARSKVAKVEHHAALPWREVGAFVAELRKREAMAARALEFAILTAARTGEVLGATWGEVDLAAAVWTVPAGRMKARREHRVPLSARALGLLGQLAKMRTPGAVEEPVFPGAKAGQSLSNMAMLVLLRRMERGDLTAHGFRSTFRDWVGEATSYPADVAEAALAHTIQDKTVAAYARGDLFDKRRALMTAWAEHCARPTLPGGGEVITLRAG